MPVGPGKYDHLAMYCLKEAEAQAVVVIVLNGKDGSGMSGKERATYDVVMQRGSKLHDVLPKLLRHVAQGIEEAPKDAFVVPDA
jgi:hypothetical protein